MRKIYIFSLLIFDYPLLFRKEKKKIDQINNLEKKKKNQYIFVINYSCNKKRK